MTQAAERCNWLKRESKIGHVRENIFVYCKEHRICKGMGKYIRRFTSIGGKEEKFEIF
jgi:hypothetical protein